MKTTILTLLTLVSLLLSCTEKKTTYPYTYIETKVEEDAEMHLYTCGDTYSIDTLKMFCQEKKEEFQKGVFHIIVLFDKKENASFPNNPLTALHNDENQLKHIKAVYVYNYLNGYSKLTTYQDNAWNSKSIEINL